MCPNSSTGVLQEFLYPGHNISAQSRLHLDGVYRISCMHNDEPDNDQTREFVPLTKGLRIGHYVIVNRIGAGGMGEVFLAEDTKLKRNVALKFLPLQYCADPQFKKRFLREAEATARLNHPNIVIIYDVGEFEGRPYFAMEYVAGTTLREVVQKEKLTPGRILELAIGICDGLQAAHSHEVIHRDIKPANIMIDSYGRPKILDFGLASLRGSEQLTKSGSAMGTIRYMSPEQVEAKPVTARSDLFSLGVVLYELVTGRTPFERDSEASSLHAIVSDEPEPMARYSATVSDDFQRIISKLLLRDPAHRYQSAVDVRADLSHLSAVENSICPLPGQNTIDESIIVLPFENSSADPDNEYFSDGLTEEIITDLGRIGPVRVISRKSSMQLKGTDKDIRTLGREYNVRYVLTGSVRRMNENIRVNAELVEADDERQVWADRYSGTMKDVFDIQEEISRAIVGALKVKLSVSDEVALTHRDIENPRAYDLYLRSRQKTELWTKEGLDQAHGLILEALKLEPDSAVLHAALGYNYYNYVNQGYHQEESIVKAVQCAEKASRLDPQSIDALRLQGIIGVSLDGQVIEGIRLLEKVLAKSPQDTEAMWWVALGYGFRGRSREAVEIAERLVRNEPFVILNHVVLAWAGYLDGDFIRALREVDAVHALEPDNALLQFSRAQIQLYSGKTEEAAEYIHIAESRPTLGLFDRLILIQLYALQGNREKVDSLMTDEFKTSARRDIQYPWHIAVARTMLGDNDEALKWLGISIDNGYANHKFLAEYDPFLKPLHDNPGFVELINRARRQAETF